LFNMPDAAQLTHTILTESARTRFFQIVSMVSEVVSNLPRADAIRCRSVSRTFYAACLPVVCRVIPYEFLDKVNPALRDRFPKVAFTTDLNQVMWRLGRPDSYTTVFESFGVRFTVSLSRNKSVIHFSSPSVFRVIDVFLWMSDPFWGIRVPPPPPPVADKHRTLVIVPPEVSGWVSPPFWPGWKIEWLIRVITSGSDWAVTIVGLENLDPASESDFLWSQRQQREQHIPGRLMHDLRTYLDMRRDWLWLYEPEPFDVYAERLLSRVEFVTLKGYFERGAWRDVLDARKVGEWLNKYDEREQRLQHQLQQSAALNEALKVWAPAPEGM